MGKGVGRTVLFAAVGAKEVVANGCHVSVTMFVKLRNSTRAPVTVTSPSTASGAASDVAPSKSTVSVPVSVTSPTSEPPDASV